MIESIGRRCRSSHLLDQPRYHHHDLPGRRPYPNCSVGRRRHMSGGRHSTTNRRRRQCSQSSLSLLAPYRVDLPCHWCGGCLGIGPRWSLLAARCRRRRASADRRNANPPIHRHRIPVHRSRRIEKRTECPQAGKKTSSALHDIPSINMCMSNDCGGGRCRCCLD